MSGPFTDPLDNEEYIAAASDKHFEAQSDPGDVGRPKGERSGEAERQSSKPRPCKHQYVITGEDRLARTKLIQKIHRIFENKRLSKYVQHYSDIDLYRLSLSELENLFDELIYSINTSNTEADYESYFKYGLQGYQNLISNLLGVNIDVSDLMEDDDVLDNLNELSVRLSDFSYKSAEGKIAMKVAMKTFSSYQEALNKQTEGVKRFEQQLRDAASHAPTEEIKSEVDASVKRLVKDGCNDEDY